jgi:hypothetical protein
MFFRKKAGKGGTYLQLVESYREEGRVRQRVLLTLGRLEEMKALGRLDALLASGSRLSQEVMVLSARKEGHLAEASTQRIGAPMVFERIWKEAGCAEALERRAEGRKFGFSLELAVFATVLHRLVASGSDRACEQWLPHYRVEGAGSLALQHFYRAMGFLGEALPEAQQDHPSAEEEQGFSPRCVKDLIEEDLFQRRRSLFTSLDLMFFDTTSIYFEGEGGESIGQRGHSKDHRPDLKQMVAGAVLDGEGHPVCCELWPGNTTDVKTLVPVARRLRERFGIQSSCLVADRGMISRTTLDWLEAPGHRWFVTPRPTPSGEGWRGRGSLGRTEGGQRGGVLVRGTGMLQPGGTRTGAPSRRPGQRPGGRAWAGSGRARAEGATRLAGSEDEEYGEAVSP